MSKPRFLCDEDTSWALVHALRQKEPALDVLRILEPGTPPSGTLDPDLLIAAQALGRVLVTRDRSTMPGHLADHFAAGLHTAGVILMRDGFPLAAYVQEIIDQWAKTTADDWIDRTIYIP
jgi:hypothetical protein